MEKSLKNNIGFLFIAIWICALVGFHYTYTIHFPKFQGFKWEQHFHGAMLMAWFFMLMIQPFLIRYKQYKWHRTIGKLGYVLAPLICYSIFLVTKMTYYKAIATRPLADVLGQISLDIPSIFLFGIFFALAMINRKDSSVHMRYMIATSLMMIGPGLGRALIIFGGMPFPVSIMVVYSITEVIAFIFLAYDFLKKRNYKPFLTIFILLVFNHICWSFQMADWWQAFAGWFVGVFF